MVFKWFNHLSKQFEQRAFHSFDFQRQLSDEITSSFTVKLKRTKMAADLELGNYPYKNLGEDNYDSGITVAQSSLQIRLGKSLFHLHLFSMTRSYTELPNLLLLP